MLQFIRDRAQGWIAWTIIGLLIIPFAFWGINTYFEGGSDAVVANVDGTEVSLNEYRDLLARQRDRVRQMLGSNASGDLVDSLVKPKDVLEAAVEREVLIQMAQKAGFRVSDAVLAEQIRTMEAFQRDGVFSKTQYEQALRARGYTPSGFEADMARGILLDQINAGIVKTAIITKADVDAHIRLRDEKRELGYAIIAAAPLTATLTPSDDQLKKYFDEHASQFVQPEEVSIEYIELRSADMTGNITVTEDELKQAYEEQKDQYGIPEERRVRHILVTIDAKKDPNGDAALKTAKDISEQLKKGESFEALAKSKSQDPGSAAQGGDLGFISRGSMDPAFEAAAFSQKEGEVSEPVKSAFGYHLIKVEAIHPTTQKPFAEVKADVERQLRNKKAQTAFYEKSDTLANLAYEKPDSLQPVADALGLKIQTTGMFSKRGGAGIAANPKVAAAAFSDDVLRKGLNSEPIEVGPPGTDDVVVVRVKEHKAEQQLPLETVKAEVTNQVKQRMARDKSEEIGKAILKQLESGADPVVAVKDSKAEWKANVTVSRNEASMNREIVNHVFKMSKPAADKPKLDGVTLANGDYAVIRLSGVKDGDPSAVDETQRKEILQSLTNRASEAEFGAMLESAKEKAKIARFEDKL